MNLVDSFLQNDSLTANGAVTHSTTLNPVLDLFFQAGASRQKTTDQIEQLLTSAFIHDKKLATKVVFWAGDIRGGAGERRFFKTALSFIKNNYPEIYQANIPNVPMFSRFDSLFDFYSDKNTMTYLMTKFKSRDPLLAKWMPREGKAKHQEFLNAFLKQAKMSKKQYRKHVVSSSATVEQLLSSKKFSKVEYAHVPSVAFNKYKNAFKKRDTERFDEFLSSVEKGESKINASAIFPHDIYNSITKGADEKSSNLQWKSLPDYLKGSDEKILPVCDVSGSMEGLPMSISISLGIYLSERASGDFKDVFMTFSQNPKMYRLRGTLTQRMSQLRQAEWGTNTNLQAVFSNLLSVATTNKVAKKDMPTTILIISDMEFDAACSGKSSLAAIEQKYKDSKYKMPKLVFWNVNGVSNTNFPASFNKKGVALLSGASPSVIKMALSANINPEQVMLDTVNQPRYDVINV